MARPSYNRAFQAYNSDNYENKPSVKKPTLISSKEDTTISERISHSPIKPRIDTSLTSSPIHTRTENMIKPSPLTPKRRLSTASLGPLLPNRKCLPMTALATKRQTLWMSIAKNNPPNNIEPSETLITPTPPQPSLLRKKILRLLLVFSYLVSISLFGIALATFYGFFWSGYSTSKSDSSTPSSSSPISTLTTTTTVTTIQSNIEPTITYMIRQRLNSTLFKRQISTNVEG